MSEKPWRSVLMSKPFAGKRHRFNLLSLVNGTGVNGTEVSLRPELLSSIGHQEQIKRYLLN